MGRKIELTPDGCIFLAGMLILLPPRWAAAAAAAAAVHEMFHYILLSLMGVPVCCVRIGSTGISMETGAMEPGQELLAALAGPLGSLLLTWLIRIAPRLALCAGIQGLYNLLPLYPLDGGRALHSALALLPGNRWKGYAETVLEMMTLTGIGCAVISYFSPKLAAMLLASLLIPWILRKRPCKRS